MHMNIFLRAHAWLAGTTALTTHKAGTHTHTHTHTHTRRRRDRKTHAVRTCLHDWQCGVLIAVPISQLFTSQISQRHLWDSIYIHVRNVRVYTHHKDNQYKGANIAEELGIWWIQSENGTHQADDSLQTSDAHDVNYKNIALQRDGLVTYFHLNK